MHWFYRLKLKEKEKEKKQHTHTHPQTEPKALIQFQGKENNFSLPAIPCSYKKYLPSSNSFLVEVLT